MLTRLVLAWIANAAAFWVAVEVFGAATAGDWWAIVFAGLALAVANAVLRPVLRLITLPLAVLTLGLAWFLVNVAMVALAAWVVPGLGIDGFWDAVGVALIVWLVNLLLAAVPGPWRARRRSSRLR